VTTLRETVDVGGLERRRRSGGPGSRSCRGLGEAQIRARYTGGHRGDAALTIADGRSTGVSGEKCLITLPQFTFTHSRVGPPSESSTSATTIVVDTALLPAELCPSKRKLVQIGVTLVDLTGQTTQVDQITRARRSGRTNPLGITQLAGTAFRLPGKSDG